VGGILATAEPKFSLAARTQAFPGAHAIWALRAGRSVRNFCRARVFPSRALNKTCPSTLGGTPRGFPKPRPRAPPQAVDSRAGFSFWRKTNNGTGRRPDVDNRRRGWNSRPDRLLDTSACDSVRNQSSPYCHGIKGRGIPATPGAPTGRRISNMIRRFDLAGALTAAAC